MRNNRNMANQQITQAHNWLDRQLVESGGTVPQRLEKYHKHMIENIKVVDGVPDSYDKIIDGLLVLREMPYIRKEHETQIDNLLALVGFGELVEG